MARCPFMPPPVATVVVDTHRHVLDTQPETRHKGRPSWRHQVPPLEEDDYMPLLHAQGLKHAITRAL